MRIAITGSNGFIGRRVVEYFQRQGDTLLPLVRKLEQPGVYWDPEKDIIDINSLENCDIFIHLSGENLFGFWTEKKEEQIWKSRVEATEFLVQKLSTLISPPKLFLGASAIGYYGDRKDELLTEESTLGHGVLAEICKRWEAPTSVLSRRGIRVAHMRFGMVLGNGGTLKKMVPIFLMGLGGKIGTGNQYVSWIAIDDLTLAMDHIINSPSLDGPINFVAPHPVTNAELTETLGKILHRPTFFTVPSLMFNLLFGKGREVYLNSTRALPHKLESSGFIFQYPNLEEALKKYVPLI